MDNKINNKYGGKANSLINLKNNDIPVPDFFVISSDFYKKFLEINNVLKKIQNFLSNKDFKKIKETVLEGKFNEKLTKEIYDEFDKLNTDEVSVRSSAGNEDGNEKSFAGQYETYLNVNKYNLLESIKKCWSSLYDDNVITYTGIENFNIFSMNVVVQKMINPNYAGVAFSLTPVSRSKNYSYIEACDGNGEKLVSGQVTPASYVVRRESKKVDFHNGKDLLNDSIINRLEELVLKIEKIYGRPMDIEWCCINDDIYILQARPITAFNTGKETIKNVITRQKALWEIELYFRGEYYGIKDLTRGMYYQNPIFNFISQQKTEIYYNFIALEEEPNAIFRTLDDNYEYFNKKILEVFTMCEEIKMLLEKKTTEISKLIEKLMTIQAFSTLGNIAGQGWKISDRLKEKLFEYREKYDYIIYKASEYIYDYLNDALPQDIKKYVNVISIDEINNIKNIDIQELEERTKGFVFYKDKILKKDFKVFCEENNFLVNEEDITNVKVINGTCAFSGKITGIIKIINSKDDFSKFNKGDIIVAPMTTPKYTNIMKIAGGIITDEGGVTCHASIVARELNIPCLVGCKNATKILKDNMKVELDATNGIVKVK